MEALPRGSLHICDVGDGQNCRSHFLPHEDAVAAMLLLLSVLAIATLGDRVLAAVSSVAASLSFSWYFIDTVGSLRITSVEGLVTFAALLITAMTGSQLSLRVQPAPPNRSAGAVKWSGSSNWGRRFSRPTLSARRQTGTCREIVRAVRRRRRPAGGGHFLPFQAGAIYSRRTRPDPLWYGPSIEKAFWNCTEWIPPSKFASALINLIGLVLERAAAAEQRARIESVQRGEELRNTILNALAHNFRTPLTCIKAAASMMRGSGWSSRNLPPGTG